MLSALFLTLTTLGAASASAIKPRQNGGGVVASNIPSRDPYNEPARGQGRRVLLYGRPDLALTVLGDPAVGTAVGIRYALEVTDSNSNRQLFETNVHDDDDEPNQFDYNDDDELRVRGTQLCVTMSGNNAFTLQNCDDSRDDDVNWVQDWEFDEPEGPKSWVHIEDDDDDNRCVTADLGAWADDTAQLTLSACSNTNEAQRFYQELSGEGSNAIVAPSGASSSQGGSATQVSSSAGGGGTPTQSTGPTTTSNPSTNLPNSTPTNAAGRRANMWGASFFRLLAEL